MPILTPDEHPVDETVFPLGSSPKKEFNTRFAFANSFRDSMGSGQVGSLACPHDPIVASYGTIPYPVFVGMRASQ